MMRPLHCVGLGEGHPAPGPWAQHQEGHSQSRKGCGPTWGSWGELLGLEEPHAKTHGHLTTACVGLDPSPSITAPGHPAPHPPPPP